MADQGAEALLQRRLAVGVGFGRTLLLDLLGGGEALARQRVDRVGFLLLALIAGAGLGHLKAQIVQVLLHGAEFRLGRGLGVPAHQSFDTGLNGAVGLDADEVANERDHVRLLAQNIVVERVDADMGIIQPSHQRSAGRFAI